MTTILQLHTQRKEKAMMQLADLFSTRDALPEIERSSYNVEIKKVEKDLREINEIIAQHEKSSTPDQVQIFFYVIASTRDKIRQNLGYDCFCRLEEDRYHESDSNKWKPFIGKDCISEILATYHTKYIFTEAYLDGEIDDQVYLNLQEFIANTIVVIDLLSLDECNRETAIRFDNSEAGLLLPFCDSLRHHAEIVEYRNSLTSKFKSLNAQIQKGMGCSLYFGDVSGLQYFRQSLNQIFSKKCPTTNQSSTPNPVRGINLSNSFQ